LGEIKPNTLVLETSFDSLETGFFVA
jgi:hypothetical protein